MSRAFLLLLLVFGCGDSDEPFVPTDPAALHDFLAAGDYEVWRADEELRQGLNGSMYRVFLSDSASADGSPVGAAAVRELWNTDGSQQLAWSAVVKVREGAGPESWFFYETYDFEDRAAELVASTNADGCASCHASAQDVIQSRW